MSLSLSFALASALLFLISFPKAGKADTPNSLLLSQRLQEVLNSQKISDLDEFFSKQDAKTIKIRYRRLLQRFPNANWLIQPSETLENGRQSIKVTVQGNQAEGVLLHSLEAKQHFTFNIIDKKISSPKLVSEYAIIQTSENPLQITLGIPEVVLTGTKYDFDVILENPLGDSIIAGGLIPITPEEALKNESPGMELIPMGGGGLFKSVQAPLSPGVQNWAAFLAHPKGLISISKMVRVVSEKKELSPGKAK